MPFGDSSQPPEKPSTAHIENVKADDVTQSGRNALGAEAVSIFLARAGSKEAKGGETEAPSITVENQGQVGALSVPRGWVPAEESRQMGGIGTRSLTEFHPPDDPNAKLTVFYRGLPVSDAGGASFHDVLDKPPHTLTADEVGSLKAVLRERSDPAVVDLKSARTEELNGKKILVIEGHYKETGTNIKEMLVDAGGDGKTVQEIYFQAPEKSYQKYSSLADEAMRSIKWR